MKFMNHRTCSTKASASFSHHIYQRCSDSPKLGRTHNMLVNGVNIVKPRAHDLVSKSVDILGKVPISLCVRVLFSLVNQKFIKAKRIGRWSEIDAYTSGDGRSHDNLTVPILSLLSTRSCSINPLHGSR